MPLQHSQEIPRPSTSRSEAETLSIVIPAYNEESRLPSSLDRIFQYVERCPLSVIEVIVVDDGSLDQTVATVELGITTGRHPSMLRVLRNPENNGKGYAVREGMLKAIGDWILFTDADLSSPIEEIEKLLATARGERAEVAIGSRALKSSSIRVHQSQLREYSGRAFNMLMRVVTGLRFRDTQCGFKLFRLGAAREIFERQIELGFSFDVESLVIAQTLGLATIEVPVVWSNVEGSKVSLVQGLKSFWDLLFIRYRALAGVYGKRGEEQAICKSDVN